MSARQKIKYIVGIDEAGRGPLAGPVAVGAVLVRAEQLARVRRVFKEAKECKQLSAAQRDFWFAKVCQSREAGDLDFAVSLSAHTVIDRAGIVPAIRRALARALRRLDCAPDQTQVLLDGALKAPAAFLNQKTIIRGDESELLIALASIAAKVTRDRHMLRQARAYPEYDFAAHKGYGSAAHYAAIRRHGLSAIHRRSYLKNIAK